jgi:hypothetical protein
MTYSKHSTTLPPDNPQPHGEETMTNRLLTAARHALEDLEALAAGTTTIDQVSGVIIELRNAVAEGASPNKKGIKPRITIHRMREERVGGCCVWEVRLNRNPTPIGWISVVVNDDWRTESGWCFEASDDHEPPPFGPDSAVIFCAGPRANIVQRLECLAEGGEGRGRAVLMRYYLPSDSLGRQFGPFRTHDLEVAKTEAQHRANVTGANWPVWDRRGHLLVFRATPEAPQGVV